jgi:hypothetical protein
MKNALPEITWYNAANPKADWDAAEVKIETPDAFLTVGLSVAKVAGPDDRWIASIDVPDGTGHGIRALIPPTFATSRDEAKAIVEAALAGIAAGPKTA